MHRNTKIATCCYCGTRAALVLGKDRHELVCASCGAALSNLKSLPSVGKAAPSGDASRGTTARKAPKPEKGKGPKRKKKSGKSKFKKMFGDILDEIEDIFD